MDAVEGGDGGIAVDGGRAEPDDDAGGAAVELGHLAYLVGALAGVGLIDADGVDPEPGVAASLLAQVDGELAEGGF